MSKVIKCNVILKGREFKAGTKESDLPGDVKKDAVKFLIDEKKYKTPGKPEASIDVKVHIAGLETQIEELAVAIAEEMGRAKRAEISLSEANSSIAGLTSQVEDAVTAEDVETAVEAEKQRADEAEAKVIGLETTVEAEKQRADDAEGQLEEAKTLLDALNEEVTDLKKAAKKQ